MKRRLALVEDNADNRLLVHALIGHLYDLTDYATGADALAGIPVAKPDLVLLDVSLPEMDGTEVLRILRADPAVARVPIVALTAHAMTGDRETYLGLGFDDYVAKPIVDEQLLLDAIARHLAT
jgi:two-component system, cell cycle response regulator DivK